LSPHVSGFGSSAAGDIARAGVPAQHGAEASVWAGAVLLRSGPVVADVGYRYKQVAGDLSRMCSRRARTSAPIKSGLESEFGSRCGSVQSV
jgi:hypothetical protein